MRKKRNKTPVLVKKKKKKKKLDQNVLPCTEIENTSLKRYLDVGNSELHLSVS